MIRLENMLKLDDENGIASFFLHSNWNYRKTVDINKQAEEKDRKEKKSKSLMYTEGGNQPNLLLSVSPRFVLFLRRRQQSKKKRKLHTLKKWTYFGCLKFAFWRQNISRIFQLQLLVWNIFSKFIINLFNQLKKNDLKKNKKSIS